MSNRMIRDWTFSEKVNSMSEKSEIFFIRLMMKADDFGRFFGDLRILKAQLFPLKHFEEQEIEAMVNDCFVNGLIHCYEHKGKKFIEIIDFGQRKRIMSSKFPAPVNIMPPPAVKCLLEVEVEVEVEVEDMKTFEGIDPLFDYKLCIEFWLKKFHVGWTFTAKHGKEMKSILAKIKKIKNNSATVVETFIHICENLPEWYADKDLGVINSKFNEVIEAIKNGKQRSGSSTRSDKYAEAARKIAGS